MVSEKPEFEDVVQRFLSLLLESKSPSLEELRIICLRVGVHGHLAIINEPYLGRIFHGKKTIESRFSKTRVAPYHRIEAGHIILLKQSSGPVQGIANVSSVRFYGPLKPGEAERLIQEWREGLCVDDDWIQRKRDSAYGSLIFLDRVIQLRPIPVKKTDRRPWVVLTDQVDWAGAGIQLSLIPRLD